MHSRNVTAIDKCIHFHTSKLISKLSQIRSVGLHPNLCIHLIGEIQSEYGEQNQPHFHVVAIPHAEDW